MVDSTRPGGEGDPTPRSGPKAARSSSPLARLRDALRSRPLLRRAGLALALVAGLVGLGAAIAPWIFSPLALIEEVAGQMRASTGLFIATKGRSTFALLPRPHILMEGVAFADQSGGLTIEADQLIGNLSIPALLAGRLEMSAIGLARPRVALDLERKPLLASGAAARAAQTRPSSPEAQKADQARLNIIAFVDGALRVKGIGGETVFEHVDATLDWRKIGAPATLTGSFSWRGERPQILGWVARPGALLRGEQSPVTMRFDSDGAHIELEGVGQTSPKPRFTGRVTAAAPSLAQALDLFDLHAPLPGPFSNLRVVATASLGRDDLQLSDLRLVADDNEFIGSLSLRNEDERPRLQADLSSNFVSLKPMLADVPALTGADGQWSRDAFDLPDLTGADVDLRLYAAHARLARLALDGASFSLTLRGGRLDLALSEAHAYKGKLRAQATFSSPEPDTVEIRATAQTTRIDAGALLWDVAARGDLSGLLDSSITLAATGDSVAALMRDLDGRAQATLTEGEIAGIDIERALRRLDKQPLSSALDIRSGRSTLHKAAATLAIVKGAAEVENGIAEGPGFSLQVSGATRIADRALALKALAREADSSGTPREKGLQIGFELTGDWSEPIFVPDARALIKRSGAAAPLLPRGEPKPPEPETKDDP